MSIQGIQQNPQDTSNFYLANIYATLADPSQSNSSSLPASPPPFSPPTYAVWVNALWFLSLVISLTCALLATLLQQWARRYLKVTQSRYSLHKQARIRAFLSEGVEKLLLPWTVETLPALLHISLFLFFAGLVVFLSNANLTIFKLVLSWVGFCTALYGCITVMPLFRRDSPYHTPLSLPAWHIVTGIPFLTFRALRKLALLKYFSAETFHRFNDLAESYGKWLVQGMQKTVEETALNSPSEIDTRALLWMFDSLDEDHELERFFAGLPGFHSSKVVDDPLSRLTEQQKWRLRQALTGLLDRTFSSDLLPAPVKERRAMLCAKAADPAHISGAFNVLRVILSRYQYRGPLAAEIVQIVRGWGTSRDEYAALDAQAAISLTVARAQTRDDSWFTLASKSLGVPEAVLRDYATYGDSLSLAVLIHITHQQLSHFWTRFWPQGEFSTVLEAASKFNVQDTLAELQHEFCALWNQIVRKVQNDHSPSMAFYILGQIRGVYISLHQDTDPAPTQFSFSAFTGDWDDILMNPSTYPLCNIPGHLDSAPHIHDDSASPIFLHTVSHDHDNTAPIPSFLASSPDMPPSSIPASLCANESFTVVPSLDNIISIPPSLQHVDQTTTENCRVPATLSNPITTHATHGSIGTSARTTHLSTPKPSASTRPPESKASISPLDAVAVEHTPASCTPPDDLVVPSSPSSPPVLLPKSTPLSSDYTLTGSDNDIPHQNLIDQS